MRKRYKGGRHGRDGGQFVAIPHAVLKSDAYIRLGAYGVKLLLDVLVQYRGSNNGALCASFSVMKERGWRSKETLQKAKEELKRKGLLVETRKGGRPNRVSLYAVTWYPLDECEGKELEVDAQSFERGAYKRYDPVIDKVRDWHSDVFNSKHLKQED